MSYTKDFLTPYSPPVWASNLKAAPTQKIQMANLPTPIHRWYLPGLPEGVEVYIKRDDMAGSTLSGNKVRKLEFHLADAIEKNCSHIITCGALQSNHCSSTAIASSRLGLKPHLILRTEEKDISSVGNILLDQLSGAKLYLVPTSLPCETKFRHRMNSLAKTIREHTGEKSYMIALGGSDNIGLWGYIEAFSELLEQGLTERFDDIAFPCGSGGTANSLALSNYLSKAGLKIHGLTVGFDSNHLHKQLQDVLNYFDLEDIVKSADLLDIVEGPAGCGYGISTNEELDFVLEVGRKTGIMLDPIYNGKAVLGLVKELQSNPGRFQGNRILYIHTGGMFGMFDGRLGKRLEQDSITSQNIHIWPAASEKYFVDEKKGSKNHIAYWEKSSHSIGI